MEITSTPLYTAQDLFLFLQSIGEEARSRLHLVAVVNNEEAGPGDITAEAVEIVDDGALLQMFRISAGD